MLPNYAAALRWHTQLALLHPPAHLLIFGWRSIAGFTSETLGTGVYPAGSVSVDTEASRISAGYSYVWPSVHWSSLDLKGCYHRTNGNVRVNMPPTGRNVDPDTSSVCPSKCSGLCLFVYMRARVNVHVRECVTVDPVGVSTFYS